MKIEARPFPDIEQLHQAVITRLQETMQGPSETPQAVLLSGGNTPLPIYQRMAEHPFPLSTQTYVAFTDDRHVPVSDAANNYAQTKPMLEALGVGEERILRVDTTVPLEESARLYHHALAGLMQLDGRYALGILGLGEDGHTCSLFEESHLHTPPGVLAVPITKQTPPHRVSVTVELLHQIDHIIFLVAGASKQEVITTFLRNPDRLVAGKAVRDARRVSLWYA